MACQWIIKNLKDPNASVVAFATEAELDLYLKQYYDLNEEAFKASGMTISKVFDISPAEKADQILERIHLTTSKLIKEVEHPNPEKRKLYTGMEEESVKLHDHPDYIGTTEFISELGNPKIGWDSPIVEKLDVEQKRSDLLSDIGSEAVVDNIINSWGIMQEVGDEVHAILQSIFRETAMPTGFVHLTEIQAQEIAEDARKLKSELLDKYGANSKFYSEFDIFTTDLDPDLKALLPNGKKGISGTVDLLVRAEDGSLHIYDFKTSEKEPGDWSINTQGNWHKNKKIAIQNQLAAYNVILEQLGFENSTTHVVPYKINYDRTDDRKIIGINSWSRLDTIDNIPETTGGRTYRNWMIMIPKPFRLNDEVLKDVDRKYQHMIPDGPILSQKIEKETKDIEHYKGQVVRLSLTDPQAHQNGKVYKYKFYPNELNKPPVYWENDEQMQKGLEEFVNELKTVRAYELDSIAVNIQKIMSGAANIDSLDTLLKDEKQEFLAEQLERYIKGGWRFVRDPDLNAFGIFIFQKDGRTEIVGMTNQHLGTAYKLTKGSSILGKTRYDRDVNSKYILDATVGNMQLMRLMTYVAENQDLFKDNKITQIKVINPWDGSQYVELNSVLRNVYNLLVQDNAATYDGTLTPITEDIFYGDVVSLLSIADEILADVQEKSWGLYEFDREDMIGAGKLTYGEDWIRKQINNLKRNHTFLYNTDKIGKGDEKIWLAYDYLLKASLAIAGIRPVQEFDTEMYLNGEAQTGTVINSTGYSPSANIRIFDDIMQEYATEVRVNCEKLGRPLVQALDAFYKSKGKNRIIGGEYTVFREWFVTDENGKISDVFRLKHPDDVSLSPESRKALTIWLDVMAKLRWPNATPDEIAKYKETERYYEVPLTEATFGKQTRALGILSALRNKWDQYSELTKGVFAGDTEQLMKWKNDKARNWRLYNKFDLDERARAAKIRERGGIGFFETDLELVMNQAMVAYMKSNISPKYITRLNALSISLQLAESHGGQSQEETRKVLDMLIKSKFYGESIIPGTHLQAFARWLNVIKKCLSYMSLGFNMRSFLREFLQGTWMGISRAGLDNMPGITKETYMKAYEYVLLHAHENFSSVSLLQQIDAHYGVANYSLGNIARKRRLDWTGIRNWNTDTAFWGSTSPDFQHRMTLIVAKMMGEGVFDPNMDISAYYLNKNGDLVYDWKRDKRFAVYAEGMKLAQGKNEEERARIIRDFAASHPEFANQRSLYMEHIAELNRIGKKYKDRLGLEREYQEGDELPEAYLPREIQAMKNYADLLYGHYDDESRSLIHDMFLGSFFMQYKTFITSRVEQWTLNPGTYNTELLQWAKDPVTGEHLYRIHNDLDADGRPNIEIKRESQIENLEELMRQNRAEKLYVWTGIPMEGIARSYVDFFKRFKGLNWENIKDIKNNPIERDNLLLGLHDTLFASFMLMLITALAGLIIDGELTTDHRKIANHVRKLGWGPSFAYNVAYGSWTDFAIWNNAWSIMGDWNPPALTAGKRVVQNAGAVILGNKSIFQAVTNTVGAAADLKGLADRFADK